MNARAILAPLNKAQRAAVTHDTGPLLLLAGAGSGKTRALTHRVAYLIATRQAAPQEIVAVTFTKKAAEEMQERLQKLLGHRSLPLVGTFHAIAARLLRREFPAYSFRPNFTIADEDDQRAVLRRILKEQQIPPEQISVSQLSHAISQWKNQLISPAAALEAAGSHIERKQARLYEIYQQHLRANNLLDFDDLLLVLLRLLQERPAVRRRYQKRFRYVLVDEYQDTNFAQAQLAKIWAAPENNICVVGDDYQAIYSWRGARIENILSFEQQYPSCRVVTLGENYRSQALIVKAANALIKHNRRQKHKTLRACRRAGEPLSLLTLSDDKEEALVIARLVRKKIAAGIAPRSIAVLYRTNAQSRALEEQMLQHGIPYQIIGGVRFYERAEIKDMLAYLRLIANPKDEAAFQRVANVPPRKVGAKTIAWIFAAAQETKKDLLAFLRNPPLKANLPGIAALSEFAQLLRELQKNKTPPAEALRIILRTIRYRDYLNNKAIARHGGPEAAEAKWENIQALLAKAEEYRDLNSFLEEVALLTEGDTLRKEERKNAVNLMTLHAAKGLEFSVVIIAGCEEGLLPHLNATTEPAALEEERRLFYVGITRAKEYLYLTWAQARHIRGEYAPSIPSSFLEEIPSTVLRHIEPRLISRQSAEVEGRFRDGDLVQHPHLGPGVIINTDGKKATVAFASGEIKRLILSQASLQPFSYKRTSKGDV